MSPEDSNSSKRIGRRRYLLTSAALGTGALAGCTGGDGNGNGNGNGGNGGSGGTGNGNGGGQQYADFDSENPHESLPQHPQTLVDHDFDVGTAEVLQSMEQRDEPRYGNPVQEVDNDTEIIDPDPLVFSFVPAEDPSIYRDTLDVLLENIADETGREVEFTPVDSFAAQTEAMRSERVHIGGYSTGAGPFAVNIGGAVPFGMMMADGRVGYRLWMIAHSDSDIDSLADVEGRSVAHVEESSNSGHQAPVALFSNEGIVPGEDYELSFSGAHDTSILQVANGDVDAAPIASGVLRRQAEAGAVDADDLKIIWMSDVFPTAPYCYRYNLPEDVKAGIERAHLEYDYSGTAIEEFFGRNEFMEIDYATHWDVILQIQEANGVEYDVDKL